MSACYYAGLTRADIDRCLCEPYGLRFEELLGFPPPDLRTTHANPVPRWSGAALLPWLQGFFRGIARQAADFGEFVALEEAGRPSVSVEDLDVLAVDRFVVVKTARILTKRPA
jgi:hypothetical protein